MVELTLAISGIIAISAGIFVIGWPKYFRETMAGYLIIIGILRILNI